MISLIGCTGLIDGGSDGLTSQQRDAQAKWEKALPVLKDNCGGCHAGERAMIDFLVGADDLAVRDRLMKYDPPVVNLEAASSSRLLTKNVHEGPGLTPSQAATVLAWVEAETDSASHDPDHPVQQLATPAAAIAICTGGDPDSPTCPTNHISLAAVPDAGATVPGAEITFNAQALTNTLYLTNLKVNGGTSGAYLEHLLFVSLPAGKTPIPDQIDRYFAMKLNVKAGEIDQIDGGTAVFGGFSATDMVALHFKVLSAFKPDSSGPATQTGCKVLASFTTNAAPQLNARCASCHAGTANPTAKGAMDITGVNATTDAAMQQMACNQVRSRINLTNTDQSGFYLAPDPASGTAHQLKLSAADFTTFKSMLDVWAKAEQKAP
jgi:mono/diheme cytochrome c family protein